MAPALVVATLRDEQIGNPKIRADAADQTIGHKRQAAGWGHGQVHGAGDGQGAEPGFPMVLKPAVHAAHDRE